MEALYARQDAARSTFESRVCRSHLACPNVSDAPRKKILDQFRNRGTAAGLIFCRAPSAPLPQRPAFDTEAPPLIAAGPFLCVLRDCIDESGQLPQIGRKSDQ